MSRLTEIGDKQYVTKYDGDRWIVQHAEIVKHERITYVATAADKEAAMKIARTLNEAEGL